MDVLLIVGVVIAAIFVALVIYGAILTKRVKKAEASKPPTYSSDEVVAMCLSFKDEDVTAWDALWPVVQDEAKRYTEDELTLIKQVAVSRAVLMLLQSATHLKRYAVELGETP